MKKLLSVLAIALICMVGATNSMAQDRPEEVAKMQVAELSEELGLNGDQQRSLFRVFVANEINYRKHINGKDLNNATVIANKQKFDSSLDAAMKKTLTAEQYTQWKSKKKQ